MGIYGAFMRHKEHLWGTYGALMGHSLGHTPTIGPAPV